MINSKENDSYCSIKQNKSFQIEANEDIDTVKVELYTYNIGENYYKVDLISKYAEVYINNQIIYINRKYLNKTHKSRINT